MAEPQVLTIPYRPHPGQREVHESRARFRALTCGARWGKDRCSVNDLIREVVEVGNEERHPSLVPRVHAWYVAPSYPMAQQAWRELLHFIPRELLVSANKTERRIELVGDRVIEVKSADNPDSLVGVGLDYVAVTEAALVAERAWEMALRPRLASPWRGRGGRGGRALLNGTPKGRNWWWRAYLRGQDPLVHSWQSWNFPTVANPWINPAEVESARLEMPDRWFRQEFLAEFLDDAGGVFRGVRKLLVECDWPITRRPGRNYVVGVDWGRLADFSVFVVLDVTEAPWQVVDFDRINEVDYQVQLGALRTMLERWKPVRVIPEANSVGDPLVSQLQRDVPYTVLPFYTTGGPGGSKRNLIESAALRVEQGDLAIPAWKRGSELDPHGPLNQLVNELEAYEFAVTRAGNVTYSAPSGMHDDCVIALALAMHGGSGAPQSVPLVAPPRTDMGVLTAGRTAPLPGGLGRPRLHLVPGREEEEEVEPRRRLWVVHIDLRRAA